MQFFWPGARQESPDNSQQVVLKPRLLHTVPAQNGSEGTVSKQTPQLPPGQQLRSDFPRFGLPRFVDRFPDQPDNIAIRIHGDVQQPLTIGDELTQLDRTTQTSDFHCVTTWSCQGLRWGGYRFRDFFEQLIADQLAAGSEVKHVVFRAQDGYRARFLLQDLLADNVLLADTLNDAPLTIAHGAPLRLVAPSLYGYKNVKHISGIQFLNNLTGYKSAAFNFMEHPRARVEFEERGRGFPGWILRYLYRPMVKGTVKQFELALARHINK